jgi:shikimate kinase
MLDSDYGEFSAVYRLRETLSTTRLATPPRSRPVRPMMERGASVAGQAVVLVGLMGAGKSSVGRRLAKHLKLDFVDADEEIVKAAGCSIEDIFELYGEDAFRDVERRVIARLLENGANVLAVGGGAFMSPEIRTKILERCVSVWLRAELDVLVRRTARRGGRPLLKGGDPREILQDLMDERYPVYAEADIVVDTNDEPPEVTVEKIIGALESGRDAAGSTGDPGP